MLCMLIVKRVFIEETAHQGAPRDRAESTSTRTRCWLRSRRQERSVDQINAEKAILSDQAQKRAARVEAKECEEKYEQSASEI